ncbi:flagellar basal body P-ring formation chaperone FlgA [Oceanicoccus sp. KOV_DT_Chl]|uniref:flagellar basal body P-ring formation chaperone FlgA n=1 Tax=Oceanicoccus sp. KOV_DT_Chl TaxID=1904639 RepID=UPI000C7DE7B8|nr:flagellar basal body P-ring formation chaperone FlgA [Oceanicoccus sp. KOV_DT_Chl]
MRVRSFLLLLSLSLSLFGPQASAAVGSKTIEDRADQFLQLHIVELQAFYDDAVRIEYQINPLDPRLAMADCPSPLDAKLKSRNTIGNINLKISCPDGRPWSLYIQAKVSLFRSVVTAVMPVPRGARISAEHVEMREVDTSRLNGSYFISLDEVLNMEASRNLRADNVVIASYINPPLVVKKGEMVQMTAQSSGLMVKISGEALMDGYLGQQISVRNNQSKRVVEAKVSAPGQVTINM